MRNRLYLLLCLAAALVATPGYAQQPGQEDLDRATELRLSAKSPQDLQQVAQLCEAAIRKGLDEEDKKFAKQLGAGAMFDLGARFAGLVLDVEQRDPRWQLYRHMAMQSLEKTIEFDPELGEAHLLIGRLQATIQGNRRKEAIEQAIQAANRAIELLEKAEKPQEYAKGLVLRASLTGEPEERLADFRKAFEADPSNSDALEGQAKVLLAQGKGNEALEVFDKLLEAADDKNRIRMTIAEALASLERYDEAIEKATEAIKADERNSLAYTLRARIHALREDSKAALDDLNKALEFNPQNLSALLIRFEIHMLDSNFKKARKDVMTMLAANQALALPYQLRSRVSSAEAEKAKDDGKKTQGRI